MSEKTVWGIHAGQRGEADSLFLNKNCVALGWDRMGNIGKLEGTREAFKEKVKAAWPDWSPGKIANSAGQLFRFTHEMLVGDIIVYPSKIDRQLHIGEVTAGLEHKPKIEPNYPQTRSVKWLKHIPRTAFSQGALYETGSALSFFQIKNYADEIFDVLEGGIRATLVDEADITKPEDLEEQTKDYIIKQLSKNLKGLPLEEFVGHLLEKMGYHVEMSRMNEPSVDLIAHKDALGFEPPIVKVQVKSSDSKIGDKDVSALYGKVGEREHGLLVTLGEYTPKAITFANSKSNLRLVDGAGLVELIFEHYEQFDAEYKGMLPLKKIYVPQVFEK